jgi:hypothetical protein
MKTIGGFVDCLILLVACVPLSFDKWRPIRTSSGAKVEA